MQNVRLHSWHVLLGTVGPNRASQEAQEVALTGSTGAGAEVSVFDPTSHENQLDDVVVVEEGDADVAVPCAGTCS